jgi:hypothetical protein
MKSYRAWRVDFTGFILERSQGNPVACLSRHIQSALERGILHANERYEFGKVPVVPSCVHLAHERKSGDQSHYILSSTTTSSESLSMSNNVSRPIPSWHQEASRHDGSVASASSFGYCMSPCNLICMIRIEKTMYYDRQYALRNESLIVCQIMLNDDIR